MHKFKASQETLKNLNTHQLFNVRIEDPQS